MPFRKLQGFYDMNSMLYIRRATDSYGIKITLPELPKIFYDNVVSQKTRIKGCLRKMT